MLGSGWLVEGEDECDRAHGGDTDERCCDGERAGIGKSRRTDYSQDHHGETSGNAEA